MTRLTRILAFFSLLITLPLIAQDFDDFTLEEPDGIARLDAADRAKEVRRILKNPTVADIGDLQTIIISEVESLEQSRIACEHLLRLGGKSRLEAGQKAITMIVPEYRMMGALLLGASGDKAAVPALLKLGQKDAAEPLIRYGVIVALGQLGDPRGRPLLKTWAADDPAARLSLCLTGDYAHLPEVLVDVSIIKNEQRLLLHDLTLISAYGWSPGQVANAKQELKRLNGYLALVPVLLRRLPDPQVTRVVTFLRQNPASEVANVLFVQATHVLTTDNVEAFLPLITGDNLELAEQLAWDISRQFPAQQTTLATHLASLDTTAVNTRILRTRLAPVGTPEQRLATLTTALKDPHPWVVLEAIKQLSPADADALRPALQAHTAWPAQPAVRQRLSLIGLALTAAQP